MAKIGAIITGDIVNSTKLSREERIVMLYSLQEIPMILNDISSVNFEIFRGDSFQILVSDPWQVLKVALIIRAFLRSQKLGENKKILDSRIAIGIGSLDFQSEELSTSDGEAYRFSGRLLDEMDKAKLAIKTPWLEVNEELSLNTAFADRIISSWKQKQSRVVYESLITGMNHNELAQKLGITRQMIGKSLRASNEDLILEYIHRFEKIIRQHLQK